MLYALIGTGLAGALATAFLLWRKSRVEARLAQAEARAKASEIDAESLRALNASNAAEAVKLALQYEGKLKSLQSELDTVKGQRDQALESLAKLGVPGAIADLLRKKNNVPSR